ncbi:MAG: aminotransferase class V-fold PLP-dependent enzyme, partial [Clostridia bacterium]|nr:aminotransferase class V-fold PLP-dependent enzyme [Clostridia bacterium]
FTSCGTESDNFAILCTGNRGAYITDKGEHAAVFQSFTELSRRKADVYFIGLNKDGSVNTEELFDYVKTSGAGLVSVVHVNNEPVAINDVSAIADKLKKINPSVIFHSDGVQAYGKIPFVFSENIDFYSVSAHKINALKGCGALVKKRKSNLFPLIFGGGQENGLRSGTENVFGIKTFQYAGEEHYADIYFNFEKVKVLNGYIRKNLDKELFSVLSGDNASPYILSVSAKGLKGEVIMHALEEYGIIVGNGSACSSRHRFSRVLEACGYDRCVLDGVIRLSFSHDNTLQEAREFTDRINETAKRLKEVMK